MITPTSAAVTSPSGPDGRGLGVRGRAWADADGAGGETLEVTRRNRDIPDGVTLHWHGLSVPSGGDGVAGVTQDAVFPGETFVYRFRAERPGPSGTTPTSTAPFALSGAAFRVLALDGGRPERTDRAERPSGASSRGGRYDLAFAIAGQPGPAATPKATSAPRRTGPRSRCRPWRGSTTCRPGSCWTGCRAW